MLIPDFRGEIRPLLPPGAFLRRDRGGALYVTNAPAAGPEAAEKLRRTLEEMGYGVTFDGPLLRIVPSAGRVAALERAAPAPPDAFSASLLRFAGEPAGPGALRLFARGVGCAETGRDFAGFDRSLRQAAALALRMGGGGGLYACALARHDALDRISAGGAEA